MGLISAAGNEWASSVSRNGRVGVPGLRRGPPQGYEYVGKARTRSGED